MTKEVKYICNFCRGNHFDKAYVYGAYWKEGNILRLLSPDKSEHHLCETCVKAISDAWTLKDGNSIGEEDG